MKQYLSNTRQSLLVFALLTVSSFTGCAVGVVWPAGTRSCCKPAPSALCLVTLCWTAGFYDVAGTCTKIHQTNAPGFRGTGACPIACGIGTHSDPAFTAAAAASASSGLARCLFCPDGTSTSSTESTSSAACTVICAAGQYSAKDEGSSNARTQTCKACPQGSYTTATQQSECIRCPIGYHMKDADTNGHTSFGAACHACHAGQYNNVTPVPRNCPSCPLGRWGNVQGATTIGAGCPSLCPAGTKGVAEGEDSEDDACDDCPAGTFQSLQGQSSCNTCAAGYHSAARSGSCSACDAGTSTTDNINCVDCPAGTFAPSASPTCTQCAAGTYSGIKAANCTRCPPGQTSSASASSCTACPPGTYTENNINCVQCPAGTASAGGAGVCNQCAAGSWSAAGASSCTTCSGGTYQIDKGQSSCTPCPMGRYGNPALTGQSTLSGGCPNQCPVGTKGIATGQTNAGAACDDCPAGKYQDQAGQPSCQECPAGTASSTPRAVAASSCVTCSAGFWAAAGASFCTPCGAGTANPNAGATSINACTTCATASWSASSAATCTLCPAGTKGSLAERTTRTSESDACDDCAAGQFQALPGQVSCNRCAAGHISSARASSCSPCAAGTNTTDGVVCAECSAGTFAPSASSVCAQCAAGTYSTVRSSSCSPCGAGFISAAAASGCTACSSGYYTSDNINCVQCAAGTYSTGASASCAMCSAGSWSAAGASSCTTCSGGRFQAAPGQGSCTPCPLGRYGSSTLIGQLSVAAGCPNVCPVGTIGGESGMTSEGAACSSCAAGTANPNTGSSGAAACAACATGSWSAVRSSVCTLCAAGKRAKSGTGHATEAAACEACAPGSYQAAEGQAMCTMCPAGTWGAVSGAVSLSAGCPNLCPVGTRAVAEGKTSENDACDDCLPGQYQDQAAQTSCRPCPAGKWCPARTAAPQECPAGKFCITGASAPQPCPKGSFCPLQSAQPTLCPASTFGAAESLASATECTKCTAGSFCGTSGLAAPTAPCRAGYYCPAGQAQADPADFICPAQRFCPAASVEPLPCPATTHQPALGKATCDACPAGWFCAGSSSAAKQPCPTGHFCPESSSAPTACPGGTYNRKVESPSSGDCVRCDPGYFCAGEALAAPTGKCAAGHFCSGGSRTAKPIAGSGGDSGGDRCPAGAFCPGGSAAPTLCAAGTFNSNPGMANPVNCTICPAGYFCGSTGLSAPTGKCSAGFFCPAGTGLVLPANQSCPAGYYCPAGAINATQYPCPPGTASNTTRGVSANSACRPCAGETYQPAAGQTKCLPCAAGEITEPVNRTSCLERTVTPIVREPTVVVATAPSKVNEQPAGLKSVLDITSVIGMLSGASAAGVAQSRLQNAMQLAACGTGEYLSSQLDFSSSPMALEIGSQPLAFHRGAVIVHIALVAASALLFYSVAALYYFIMKPASWRVACLRIRMPGIMTVPISILVGGAAEVSAALLWHGKQPLDYVFGALDLVLLVIVPVLCVCWVSWKGQQMTNCQLKPYVKKQKEEEEEENRKRGQQQRSNNNDLLELELSLNLEGLNNADGDNNEEEGEVQRGPNKNHCFARNCPSLYRGYRWLAVNHSEWYDNEPELVEVDADGAKNSLDVFVLHYNMVYEDYNSVKFGPAEYMVTALLGCTAGIATGVLSRTACLMWLFVATLILWLHVAALLYFRPVLNRGLAFFVTSSTVVAAVTTLLAMLQFLNKSIDYPTSYLSITWLQTLISLFATILNFAAAAVITMNVWSAYQRGKMKKLSNSRHTFNFDDLELEMELLALANDNPQQEEDEEIDLSCLNDVVPIDEEEDAEIDLGELVADDEEEIDLSEFMDQLSEEVEVPVVVEQPPAPPPPPPKPSPQYALDDDEPDNNQKAGEGPKFDEFGNRIGSAACANAEQLAELRAALARGGKKK